MTDPKSIILKPNTSPEFVGDWNLLEVQQVVIIFYNQVQAQVAKFLQKVSIGKLPADTEQAESIQDFPDENKVKE
jgi:hypothetical protein